MSLELTAKLVGTLREKVNLPLMKCKNALVETKNDENTTEEQWLQKAIEHLRKQGENASDRFAGRETPCGRIGTSFSDNDGAIVLLGCQTDFVANSEVFVELTQQITDYARALIVDEAKAAFNEKVKPLIVEAIAKLGENIVLSKAECLLHSDSSVTGYNHGGKIGVLVSGTGDVEKIRQVALHIASTNPDPISIGIADIAPDLIAKETEIILSLPDVLSKPEAIREKMLVGRLNRFYKERVLMQQEMLFDVAPFDAKNPAANKKETVSDYCVRNGITITSFIKYSIG